MNIRRLIETALIKLLSFPIALLPHKIALNAGSTLGLLIFYLWGSRRRIAIENIKMTIGDKQWLIAKETFKNLGISLVEVIKIYYGLGGKIIDNVEVKGIENYNQAKLRGRGIILITGHCGNWELMGLTLGVKIANVTFVARKQNNPYLNKLVEKTRVKYGNKIVYKKGALKVLLSELKKNKGVGILMDQAVLKNEGYIIDFLGKPAWTTKMPALIARKTDAAVIPVFINRDGDRHVINIHPEVILSGEEDIEKAIIEDTKNFSKYIEDYIKSHPSEWLWIHRRWKRVE